jgi:hypothetical protein
MPRFILRKLLTIVLIAAIIDVQANAQASSQGEPEPAAPVNSTITSLPITSSPDVPEKPNEAQIVSPGKAKIAAGTTLEFALLSPLSSVTSKPGDDVTLRLLRPLVAGNTTLLAAGTIVHGRVKEAKPAKPNCKNGTLQWSVNRLSFADGSTVRVENGLITSDDTKAIPYKTALQWDPNWFELVGLAVALAPVVAIGAVLFVAVEVPMRALLFGDLHDPFMVCTTAGHEVYMPTTTRVGLVVKKDHTVRF